MRSRPQETLEVELNKEKNTFSFNPPINHAEEEKWLWAVTSFELKNSVFNITDEKKSFSISTPGQWNLAGSGEIINKLNKLLELGSQIDIENL